MVSDYEIIMRLVLVSLLTGVIGFEREIQGRVAGLRTHILVGLGSCLMMLTSMHLFDIYRGIAAVDPARIAAQVVSGIGFLGAGTIIRFRASVRGLTTAASLWASSGVGIAVGAGFYTASVCTTVLIWAALFVLPRLEHALPRKIWYKTLHIETTAASFDVKKVREIISRYPAHILDMEVTQNQEADILTLELNIKLFRGKFNTKIISDILELDNIASVRWLD